MWKPGLSAGITKTEKAKRMIHQSRFGVIQYCFWVDKSFETLSDSVHNSNRLQMLVSEVMITAILYMALAKHLTSFRTPTYFLKRESVTTRLTQVSNYSVNVAA